MEIWNKGGRDPEEQLTTGGIVPPGEAMADFDGLSDHDHRVPLQAALQFGHGHSHRLERKAATYSKIG